MASIYIFCITLLAAMFLRADGYIAGSLSDQELEARCQSDSRAVFPHPGQCQLYYNCSNTVVTHRYFSKYLEECTYPDLFSTVTLRCHPFDDVTCGERVEHADPCNYLQLQCGSAHCMPCHMRHPSCEGLPDGANVFQNRPWSPHYVVCRSGRTLNTSYCEIHPTLEITQLFHPDKQKCVSLYEVPRERSGYLIDCSQKPDGLHLDDVTFRPDVFYRCDGGQFVDVNRCGRVNDRQLMYDEASKECSFNPEVNSILGNYGSA